MQSRTRAALLCVAAPIGFFHAAGLSAQTSAPATTATEPAADADIIVTARRVEERLQDVPISITVFSQQQLTNRNIINPTDLATYTPSLAVNSRFGPEKATFAIRGFNQEPGTQPSVGIYFADVISPRASGSVQSGNGATAGSLFDLQNVQVLKGPQGTLFGRNTTGGAVLLVPQKPTAKFEGFIEGSYGNYDMKRVQAVLNAPLGDSVRLRLGVDRLNRDGYLHNRSGIGPDDFADANYLALRASLVIDLAPTLENYTIASYSQSDTHGQIARLIACNTTPGLAGTPAVFGPLGCNQLARQNARGDGYYDVENSVPNPFIHLRQWQAINTTKWDVSDTLTVRNIVSYAEFRERTRINIYGDNLFTTSGAAYTAPGLPLHFVTVVPGPTGNATNQATITEELQFQGSTADRRLQYQFGGYLERSDPITRGTQVSDSFMNCTNFAALQCTSPTVPTTRGRASLTDLTYSFHGWGLYAQATYKLTSRLNFTGGIRYTYDKTIGTAQNAYALFLTPNTPTFFCTKVFSAPGLNLSLPTLADRTRCRESQTQVSQKPTWLVDLDYKPTEDVLLYAKYARGYRQGTVNLTPTGVQFQTAAPEKVDLYEVGAKTSLRGAIRGTFNVSAFWNRFTNQQISANLVAKPNQGLGGVVPINAGTSRIRGIEAELSLGLFKGFRLDASYAYLDAKLLSINVPVLSPTDIYSQITPSAIAGQPLIYTPKHKATLTGTYTLPIDRRIGTIALAATYTHTDKQYSSRQDDAFINVIGYNPGLLPATDLLNLNLNWNNVGGRPIDIGLFATNVTGVKYRTAITGGMASVGYESVIRGEPRMYGARLKYRFGK